MDSHPAVDKEFLERILKQSVKSLTVSGGSNPGDNFTSILFGIEVLLKDAEKPLYLLMKTYPSHPARQKFLEGTNLFVKELFVYKLLIPEYIRFQEEAGNKIILKPSIPPFIDGRAVDYPVGQVHEKSTTVNRETEGPICEGDVENYLLMVDIRKTLGFKMTDKRNGLDFDHCKLVIVELAKLHSISLAYKTRQGLKRLIDSFPFLIETLFTGQSRAFLEPLVQSNFKMVLEIIQQSSNKHSEAEKSIKKLEMNFMEVFDLFLDPNGVHEAEVAKLMRVQPANNGLLSEEQWIVGNHGDCWINNMLFKYNETNKPVETVLVDFQICRESCLTVDLAYFFFNSTDHHFRTKHLDEMLELYYDSFVQFCEILNTEPFLSFTLKNLKARFHRSKVLGFLFSVLVLPIILQNPEGAVNLDTVQPANGQNGDSDFADLMNSMLSSKSNDELMKARFLGMVNQLVEEGIL